ncbi:membrane protein [Dyella thiooxydans]|uniref:Membrane protein n=2 Tax=Dyella thiooxydans TaxID=445710 RepID=A0A160N4I7_9GAMM|nr:membrane protein [Dyella thiooxydans]
MFDIALYVFAALLMLGGLAGAVLPALPGIPMIFAGIWLAAAVDGYRHLGLWWLIGLGVLGTFGVAVDFIAGALGARRVGASRQAIWGATLGTFAGLFFGIPGLLLGPFAGALAGELLAGQSVLRSTHVGVGTWLGLLFGTLVKLVVSFAMLGLFALGMLLG